MAPNKTQFRMKQKGKWKMKNQISLISDETPTPTGETT